MASFSPKYPPRDVNPVVFPHIAAPMVADEAAAAPVAAGPFSSGATAARFYAALRPAPADAMSALLGASPAAEVTARESFSAAATGEPAATDEPADFRSTLARWALAADHHELHSPGAGAVAIEDRVISGATLSTPIEPTTFADFAAPAAPGSNVASDWPLPRAAEQVSGPEHVTPLRPPGSGLDLWVEAGRITVSARDLIGLVPGSVITLDRQTDDPLEILLNAEPIGRGRLVPLADGRLGIEIAEIYGSGRAGGAR